MNIALLTAAGSGTRMGQDVPKQFMPINNKPVVIYTMEAFQAHPDIDAILVVTLPAWIEALRAYAVQYNITKLRWIVSGGETNQESIFKGLKELEQHCEPDDAIMIHDGNRCRVSEEIITDSLATFHKYGSAVAAIPCVEAVFFSQDRQTAASFIPREQIMRTQTPHTYSLGKLLWAHGEAQKRQIKNTTATCTLMSKLGEKVFFSKGSEENLKLTTTEDVRLFRALLMMSATETGWKEPPHTGGGYNALIQGIFSSSLRRAA